MTSREITRLNTTGPLSAIVYLKLCGFCSEGFPLLLVLGMGCVILLWHSLGLPYNYLAERMFVFLISAQLLFIRNYSKYGGLCGLSLFVFIELFTNNFV